MESRFGWRSGATGAEPGAKPQAARRAKAMLDVGKTDANALDWPAAETGRDSAPAHEETGAALQPAKTILIADDDPVVAFALKRRLEQLGYDVLRSPDSAHALLGAMKMRPDLIILDVNMPGGNGLAVCEMMGSDPRYSGIPVIIHSTLADEATKWRCENRLKILCIDDDPVIVKSIALRLEPYGIEVIGAPNGTQGFYVGLREQPDLILLDLQMPEGEGNYVLGRFQAHSRAKEIPIVILTVETNPGVRRGLIACGAAGFLSKPVRWKAFIEELGHHVSLPPRLIHDYRLSEEEVRVPV